MRDRRIAPLPGWLRRGERGQALIFFVGIMTLMMGVAALAVDVGLWYTDKAVAKKDANMAADNAATRFDPSVPSTFIDAENQAYAAAASNGIFGGVNVLPEDCLGVPEAAIRVEVERQSSALFSRYFGVDDPDTPGTATACVGSARTIQGGAGPAVGRVRPIAVVKGYDDVGGAGAQSCLSAAQLPRFGTECVLFLRRPGTGFPGNGWERIVDLNGPGPACSGGAFALGDIDNNMETGAPDPCSIGNQVFREVVGTARQRPGRATTAITNARIGLDNLLALDDCDPGGVDDFDDVVVNPDGTAATPGSGLFARQSCDGDRLVLLPVITGMPANFGSKPIDAFMPFFITSCVYQINPGGPLVSDPDCDGNVPGRNFDPANDAFGIAGYPIKLQEPVDGPVKGFDRYGTYRPFLYED